jgi:hypothetical protein
VQDDGEFEESPTGGATGTSRKANNKIKMKAKPKGKSTRLGDPRVANLEDEVTVDATARDSELTLVDREQVSDSPMSQQNPNANETPPPQDAKVSLTFLISSEIVPMCDFGGTPRSAKSNPSVYQIRTNSLGFDGVGISCEPAP